MVGSILLSAPAFTSRSSIIRNSNIVICEPRFDRSAEPIRRISEHLVIWGCHHGPNCGNESSLCMERIWVLLQSLHEHWSDFTARKFLDGSRPLHVRPNAGRYVQHWVIYKWNSSCPPTSFLPPPLSVTATHHFRELLPLHIFLPLEERRKTNVLTGGKFVGTTQSGDPEVCAVKSLQIQKWASFTWSFAIV